jgi:phytoene synthase
MDNFAHAADLLRRRDRDRYLADLYAPANLRRHLFALHAFAVEVARVREAVSEPALGEIRLQWWRDAITNRDAAGHPIAAALIETMAACRLPASALDVVLEARIFDLYDDPMPTLDDLEGYAGETTSVMLQLGALILNGGVDPGSADAAGHGGVAETLVNLMQRLSADPRAAAKYVPDQLLQAHNVDRAEIAAGDANLRVQTLIGGLRVLARRHLDIARAAAAKLPPLLSPLFLPLAVAGARLERLGHAAAKPFGVGDLPAWRRQWIIWRAARSRQKAA